MNRYKILSTGIVITFLVLLAVFLIINKPIIQTQANYQETLYGNKNADVRILSFVYSSFCDDCNQSKQRLTRDILPIYGDRICIEEYPIDTSENLKENYKLFASYGFTTVPGIVVTNRSVGKQADITLTYTDIINTEDKTLEKAIEYQLKGNYSKNISKPESGVTIINTPFGKIKLSDLSLPILTIVLGAMDSINPCSFFVLLFLLSFLLYTKSRKRMILIGSIFIFFSGFIYFLFMAAILNVILVSAQQVIISFLAGLVAIVFGTLNIKDFFYFKKGPSASLPESQKPRIYKQMRKLVKITSIPSLIIGTIILAISVNTVELLCSFNLPFIYTTILTSYHLNAFNYYMYLLFYNIIYVIPLLIIVSAVVITLGRWKLSEFQGRMLKLFSGIMIFSLGEILLLNPTVLSNFFIAIAIFAFSFIVSFIVYLISKKYNEPKKIDQNNDN